MAQTGITEPEEAVRMMNSGELEVRVKKWIIEDGIICFSVKSDGASGNEWITRLNRRDIRLTGKAEKFLLSKRFKATSGKLSKIIILKNSLFQFYEPDLLQIRQYAETLGFSTPDVETACLIREKLSSKDVAEMGCKNIAVMHKPIRVDGEHLIFNICDIDNITLLSAISEDPNEIWSLGGGFAFTS